MSAYHEERHRPRETIAGYLAALALFVSLIGIAYRPVRLIPAALVVALIALAMSGRGQRLPAFALAVGGVAWIVGMAVAVATNRPLF